jgi:hypothetical protein
MSKTLPLARQHNHWLLTASRAKFTAALGYHANLHFFKRQGKIVDILCRDIQLCCRYVRSRGRLLFTPTNQ